MKKQELSIIIFGGTGDLAKRKLAPAFVKLIKDGIIEKHSNIIGISRKDLSDLDYKKMIFSGINDNDELKFLDEINVKHVKIDIEDSNDFSKLHQVLPYCEREGCNRIYYLATDYKLFSSIINGLKENNLSSKEESFTRIVFEKPFGKDLESSDEISRSILKIFNENQIYRIDHYLGKEAIRNINVLKFTNPFLWNSLNNKFVDKIEINIDEEIGVGNRLNFYNSNGAIKDMIQNHLLSVLSILLMEIPEKIDGESINKEKENILKKLKLLNASEHVLGQYKSYQKELQENNLENINTETFAKISMECNNKRWKGVKLILRTGKKLSQSSGQIIIHFKDASNEVKKIYKEVKNNKIIINIQPKLDIKLCINSKNPNLDDVKLVSFDFSFEEHFGPNTPLAYESLLSDIINNDKKLFASSSFIHASWIITQKIEKIKDKIKFVIYEDGSEGEKIT